MFLMETILQPSGGHALKAFNRQLEGNSIKLIEYAIFGN